MWRTKQRTGGRKEPALGWRVQRCPPSCAGDQTGGAKVPSGSRASAVEARDGEAASSAPAHPPSVLPQVVPCPSKTDTDAHAAGPAGEALPGPPPRLDVQQVLNLHRFVPLLGWLGPGTKPYTLQPFLHASSWGRQEPELSLALCSSSLWKRKPPAPTAFWGWQVLNMLGTAQYFWLAGIARRGL